MTEAAVRAAKAVNYVGAGTIEFIADASEGLKPDRIWFMEMNTRLQVEHPVTEAITGVDLVEWQFRVAAGEPIPLKQADIPLNGWAMEARLYAEDPDNGFLPSIGRLDHFQLPDDLRVDTGVEQGGEVSQHYDPMIAKLIVHEDTREAAAARLADACCEVEVWPVRTNAAFLARCLDHPRFVSGDVDTGFIGAEEETLLAQELKDEIVAAGLTDLFEASRQRSRLPTDDGVSPWSGQRETITGFRLNAPERSLITGSVNGVPQEALLTPKRHDDASWYEVSLNGQTFQVAPGMEGIWIGERYVPAWFGADQTVLFDEGHAVAFTPASTVAGAAAAASDGSLRAPMPGKIVAVSAEPGQAVTKGQSIVVLEAMKMEHALTAPFDGTVGELGVAVGDQVTDGAVLATITASEGEGK